jgi:hypothetical protein
MQISRAVTSGVVVSPASLLAVVVAGAAIHLVYLAFNLTAVKLLRIGGNDESGRQPPSFFQGVSYLYLVQLTETSSLHFEMALDCAKDNLRKYRTQYAVWEFGIFQCESLKPAFVLHFLPVYPLPVSFFPAFFSPQDTHTHINVLPSQILGNWNPTSGMACLVLQLRGSVAQWCWWQAKRRCR